MIVISSQDLQNSSIVLSSSELAFSGKVFTRSQTVKQALRKTAILLAQDIQRIGKSCILVDHGDYFTVWSENRRLNSIQEKTLARLKRSKSVDWAAVDNFLNRPEENI